MTDANFFGLPKITVVTPSFKSADTIEATIQSVLSQKYPNLQYIIVDGAGDAASEVIRRYEKDLFFWESKKDDGQYDAIIRGFTLGDGDVLFWLNADDKLLPNALLTVGQIFSQLPQVQWLSSTKPGLWDAFGALAAVSSLPGFSKNAFLDGFYLPGTRRRGHWIQQESTFFTKTLWQQVGSSFPSYELAGDFALWCQMYRHAELYGCAYPIGGFRLRRGQRSEDMARYKREAQAALERLRADSSWSRPSSRAVLADLKAASMPRLGALFAKKFGYSCSNIYNVCLRDVQRSWLIKNERFLP